MGTSMKSLNETVRLSTQLYVILIVKQAYVYTRHAHLRIYCYNAATVDQIFDISEQQSVQCYITNRKVTIYTSIANSSSTVQ